MTSISIYILRAEKKRKRKETRELVMLALSVKTNDSLKTDENITAQSLQIIQIPTNCAAPEC